MSEEEPAQWATHRRTFEAGWGDTGFAGFQQLIVANMERLANRVCRPCEVTVTIEVRDRVEE